MFEFGIITSAMHMAWMATLTGRLESRFRYSNKIVYNNFPWPQSATEAQKAAVEKAAQAVLDVRAQFTGEGARASARFNVESSSGSHSAAAPSPVPAVKRPEGRAPGCTLADLYDPEAMPPALAKAHTDLDRAVDRCYRKDPFPSDRARVEYLFQLYEQLTAPLAPSAKAKPKRSRKS